ncbi:MAG: hypothetical protein SCH98_04395 [Deferrisomatales bacterium]|nr:hypothetical protein [Deferrisomatales bacterium]
MNRIFDIEYTVQIWKEWEQFVAHALPLDVMSAGPTVDGARRALAEAVQLFLLTAQDMGTVEQILEESGDEVVKVDGVGHRALWRRPRP